MYFLNGILFELYAFGFLVAMYATVLSQKNVFKWTPKPLLSCRLRYCLLKEQDSFRDQLDFRINKCCLGASLNCRWQRGGKGEGGPGAQELTCLGRLYRRTPFEWVRWRRRAAPHRLIMPDDFLTITSLPFSTTQNNILLLWRFSKKDK